MQLTLSEKIQKAAARLAIRMPLPIMKRLAGKPITANGYTMDPVIQVMVK